MRENGRIVNYIFVLTKVQIYFIILFILFQDPSERWLILL